MVIPLGPMGMPREEGAPDVVKDRVTNWWWALVCMNAILVIARFYDQDAWGGFVTIMMTVWAVYMVMGNCKRMSQYCVLLFGTLCFFEFLMDLINLMQNVNGRSEELINGQPASSSAPGPTGSEPADYKIKIVTHPFFDGALGFLYNFQSGMMIAIPVWDFIGLILAVWTYHLFPTSLFEDDEETQGFGASPGYGRWAGGGNSGYGGGGGGTSGYGGGGSAGGNSGGGRPVRSGGGGGGGGNSLAAGGGGNQYNAFQGSGNRLGS